MSVINPALMMKEIVILRRKSSLMDKLYEQKGQLLRELRIEYKLNPSALFFSNEEVLEQGADRTNLARGYSLNKKLKRSFLVLNVAEEQKNLLLNIKNKFIEDSDNISVPNENEDSKIRINSYLNKLYNRLNKSENAKMIAKADFENNLKILFQLVNKITEKNDKTKNPIWLAKQKFINGVELTEFETLLVIYSKWKALNRQLKLVIKKLYKEYFETWRKYRDVKQQRIDMLLKQDNCITHPIIAKEDGNCSTAILSPADSEDMDIETNCMAARLAKIGSNATEITKTHYKLDKLKKKFKLLQVISATSLQAESRYSLFSQISFTV